MLPTRPLATALVLLLGSAAAPPSYSIQAVRYATIPQFPLASLIPGSPADARLDIAMVFWLIRGDGRVVLFDSGFHRENWRTQFKVADFLRPDSALAAAGVSPAAVTDVIVSHAHWDHMGGIDLFPNATIWIQREEYRYYTADAWQSDGRKGGIDREDVLELVRRNVAGKVQLLDGDDVEILPGIRAYTGARHTYAAQYIRVDGDPPYVLASDNAYLYRNIEELVASATFLPADRDANRRAVRRMIELAGDRGRVVPGHDPAQFSRFPTKARIATVKREP
ncbi:MAG TPA: N-acyl homoserine lactonase family protein [Longimicrobiales bacterium]|nr:N-acyl homoserine lactonase family protein [Longimicrobiales bacterium]